MLALLFGLGHAPSLLAQTAPFDGRWLLDGQAATPTTHTHLAIKDGTMSWSRPTGSAPKCTQQFVLKKERPGTMYTNGRGTKFIAGVAGSIPTYLLAIGAGDCGDTGEELRISFPLVYDTKHIEVIGYVKGKPVGARRFRRVK